MSTTTDGEHPGRAEAAELERRFDALVDALAGEAGVTIPGSSDRRGFGSAALKVNGSIFAMLSRGRLVVKLPRERVAALIDAGTGGPFDAGKGTPMKEWLTVMDADDGTWLAIAREAMAFVGRRATAGPTSAVVARHR